MRRRSFIGSILALAAAPAIVRADSLMRVIPRETLFDFESRIIGVQIAVSPDVIVCHPSYTDAMAAIIREHMKDLKRNLEYNIYWGSQ